MNLKSSFNGNIHQLNNPNIIISSSHNNSCIKDKKSKQFLLNNNNIFHNNTSVNTPKNISASSSQKLLLTRINYKKKIKNTHKQLNLPILNGDSSSKIFFSPRNCTIQSNNSFNMNNVLKKYGDHSRRKYRFYKIGFSPEQIHKNIINSVKDIHHKSKIKHIDDNSNNNDECFQYQTILNNKDRDSIYDKTEQIKFAKEYNKKIIDQDIRHIILFERKKAKEKINTLYKEQHNKQIIWNKPQKPVYLQKLEHAMFIRKNHPMLEINQVGTLPEIFSDGNFMNQLFDDGFSNVSNTFKNVHT